MERISLLLQKIEAIQNSEELSVLDIDLMMDYTKQLYAELIEWRTNHTAKNTTEAAPIKNDVVIEYPKLEIIDEPTLEEMAQSFEATAAADETIDEENEETSPPESIEEAPIAAPVSPFIQNKVAPDHTAAIDLVADSIPQYSFPKNIQGDVRKFIGINEKFVFINELFSGNRDAYEEVLGELSQFSNTEDAIKWLKQTVMPPYGWTEDDFNVQDFFRILEIYYKRVALT